MDRPSQILEKLVEQLAFLLHTRIEPETCRTGCHTDVVHIGNVGTFADNQTVVATAPVVLVEIVVNITCIGHRERSQVHQNGKVNTARRQLALYLGRNGKQTVQTGNGDSHVGIVVAFLGTVEHQAIDFILVRLDQIIGCTCRNCRGTEGVSIRPSRSRLLVVVVKEEARAITIHETLQSAEHHTLSICKRRHADIQRLDRIQRRKEERQQTVLGPAKLIGFEDAVTVTVEVVGRVGKSNLFHLAHVSTDSGAVGKRRNHRRRLLSLCNENRKEKRKKKYSAFHNHQFLSFYLFNLWSPIFNLQKRTFVANVPTLTIKTPEPSVSRLSRNSPSRKGGVGRLRPSIVKMCGLTP